MRQTSYKRFTKTLQFWENLISTQQHPQQQQLQQQQISNAISMNDFIPLSQWLKAANVVEALLLRRKSKWNERRSET